MLNDPPPENRPITPPPPLPLSDRPQRRPHPLEVPPDSSHQQTGPQRQQIKLHITSVKPYLTYALVILNIAIFAVGYLIPAAGSAMRQWGANIPQSVMLQGDYYRLFTSMFLHAGLAHILLNAAVLYSFGSMFERIVGHARFALIYLLGGLAGSILSVIMRTTSAIPSVGASGAIFALLGAEYVFLYKHRKLMGVNGQSRRRQLVIIGAMNLAVGFLSNSAMAQVQIDNWAHLGGAVGGFLLAWYICPDFILRRHPVHDNDVIAEDINPLNKRYAEVSLYVAGLLGVLIAAALFVRR